MSRMRFEEEPTGAWRARLSRWEAPEAAPRLEQRLLRDLRLRRRAAALRVWGGRAAAAVIVAATALALRFEGRPHSTIAAAPAGVVALAVSENEVRAELDLTGFEPIRRPRLTRVNEVVVETDLAGFVPIGKPRLTRWSRGEGR